MKYDESSVISAEFRTNDNVHFGRVAKERRKVGLLDVFIVQAAVCVAITVAVAVARFLIGC